MGKAKKRKQAKKSISLNTAYVKEIADTVGLFYSDEPSREIGVYPFEVYAEIRSGCVLKMERLPGSISLFTEEVFHIHNCFKQWYYEYSFDQAFVCAKGFVNRKVDSTVFSELRLEGFPPVPNGSIPGLNQ